MSIAFVLLATLLSDVKPWLHWEANSEQRQPVYFGLSPLQLSRGVRPEPGQRLPLGLRFLGESQLLKLRHSLSTTSARIDWELWPVLNDDGQMTWAIARYREGDSRPWRWLRARSLVRTARTDASPALEPELPIRLRPWKDDERKQIFQDFLESSDLYFKPLYGGCVWTNEDGSVALGAWLPPAELQAGLERFGSETRPGRRAVCHAISQPARAQGVPFSLVATTQGEHVRWPAGIEWVPSEETSSLPPLPLRSGIEWPGDFLGRYSGDILALDGEDLLEFPITGKKMRVLRKNSADPGNELLTLVEYLEERYATLGIRTLRQEFSWRGIPQSNLIAVIPGSERGSANRPVVLADHIDTAFCEDTFATSHRRSSAPGADDNVTAVAALLRGAEILSRLRPKNDIWLLHLTGEEFPGDDLGARRFVAELLGPRSGSELGELLGSRGELTGIVLMDMIGFRQARDPLFQINAGNSPASLRLAKAAQESAEAIAGPEGIVGILRSRFDAKSYLYNTDGLIFSDAGIPVVLLNEHINALENLNRSGYHERTDTTRIAGFDTRFAAAIARTAIETAARLAGVDNSL